MDIVKKQSGVMMSFRRARIAPCGQGGYLESMCQVYDEKHAEHVWIGNRLRVHGGRIVLEPCAIASEDQVEVDGVVVDKKRMTVTRCNAREQIAETCTLDKVIVEKEGSPRVETIKLDRVDKIIDSEYVGSVSVNKDQVLLTVALRADHKDPEYDRDKFKYKDPLGEGLVDHCGGSSGDSKLLQVTFGSPEVKVIDTADKMPLKAEIAANGVIYFLGLDRSLPRNTGIKFCANKPIGLYRLDSGETVAICKESGCRSMVFSADRTKFAYLRCALGGAHFKASELVLYDTETNEETILQQDLFAGSVFGMNLPDQKWADWIYLTVQEGFFSKIVRVDAKTGKMEQISKDKESWSVLAVNNGWVLGQFSSALSPPALGIYRDNGLVMSQRSPECPGKVEILSLHRHLEVLVVVPARDDKKQAIMKPHGGPNSNFVNEYSAFNAALVAAGYTVCLVNYTGSTAYDNEGIDRLIEDGKVGILDVEDCMLVRDELGRRGFETVHILGGSHGGYLAACLSSKFPKKFSKCIMVNPVVTLYANCVASDIFDYVFETFGLEFDFKPPTQQELLLFHERSPKPTSENPPTLIALGADDKRVPPYNGLAWYGWLRRLGVKVECLMFPKDNHSLASPEADRDLQVACLEFLGI